MLEWQFNEHNDQIIDNEQELIINNEGIILGNTEYYNDKINIDHIGLKINYESINITSNEKNHYQSLKLKNSSDTSLIINDNNINIIYW